MPLGAIRALIHPSAAARFNPRKTRRALAALSVATAASLSSHAFATTATWVGNDTANWSDALNWNPTATPASGSALVFGVPGSSGISLNDDLGPNFTAAGITFLSTAGQYTFGTTNTSTLNLSGTVNDFSTLQQSMLVDSALGGNVTFNAVTASNITFGHVISGTGNIIKTGAGTLILTAANNFSGNLIIGVDAGTSGSNPQVPLGGGTVVLNFNGAGTSPVIPVTTTVSIGASTFDALGATGASNTQTIAGLNLQAGFSTVQAFTPSGAVVLNLGAISTVVGNLDDKAAQLNFLLPSGTQTSSNGITTSNLNSSGILISHSLAAFTVNSTDWATNATNQTGHNIIGLSQSSLNHYTPYTGATFVSSTANLDIQKDGTISTPGQETCQTIRFNTSATTGLTDTLTVGANQIVSVGAGGILITPNVGSTNAAIAAGNGTSVLRGALNIGLSIFQYDSQNTFTINPIIADNGGTANAVTIGGGGTVALTAANTYTNSTTVGGGSTLVITSNANLGSQTANASLNLNQGTLQANASFGLNNGATNRAIGLGTYGGTFDVTSTNTLTIPGVISDSPTSPGSLTKTDSGTLVLSNANTYGGGTIISAGTLVAANASGSATGGGNITMNGGVLANTGSGSVAGNVIAGTGAHTIAPGGVGTVGTLALNGLTSNSFTTLNFDLGSGAGPEITNGDLLNLGAGTVSIASGTLLAFAGTPTVGDDYRLIGGAIAGINLANFTLPVAPAGSGFSLSKAVDGGFIDLVVTGLPNLRWNNGAITGLWNTIDANWNSGSGNTAYVENSNVTFDDSNGGGGNYNVTLNTTVKPGSITINNSAGSYVISGTGSIAGAASLTKTGSGTAALSTVNTYSGLTTVSSGTLIAAVTGAIPNGPVSIQSGTLQLGASTGGTTITSLAINGNGTLDITNNHVIIDYGSSADPVSSIAALLATGYNGGLWNGVGGITSSAIAANPGYGVGYADSADTGNPAGLASGTMEIAFTLLGDADLNHTVNGIDFGILAANFNKGVSRWDQGDFNYDNIVNGVDFGALAANFNKGASSASDIAALDAFAAANGLLADVPEPATTGILALGALGLLARRRRHRAPELC